MGNIGPIRQRFEVLPDDLNAEHARVQVDLERAVSANTEQAPADRERRRSRG